MIHEHHPERQDIERRGEGYVEREREPDYRDAREYDDDPVVFREGRSSRSGTELESRTSREPRSYSERRAYEEPYDEYEGPYEAERTTVFSTSGINILAGLWLILAPFALNYGNVEAAVWNSIIIGLAVGIMAIVRVMNPEEYEGVSWVNFVLGIWLLVSPFVLGLANIEALVWNNIIVGVIVLALAATSALATRKIHDPTMGSRSSRGRSRSTSHRRSYARR